MVNARRKAWAKNNRREIKNTLGRFIAILAIVALGVGFFAGLKVTKTAMTETCDDYVNDAAMFDYRLISTLGFEEKDLDYFETLGGVKKANGSVQFDFLCSVDNESVWALRAHTLTNDINIPKLSAGRMPTSADECVVDDRFFMSDFSGKTLKISDENDSDTLEMLKYNELKVVGLIKSIAYMSEEMGATSLGGGALNGFIYLPKDTIDTDYYTEIFLKLYAPGQIFSDEYIDYIDSKRGEIETAVEMRAKLRYDEITTEANEEIADAETEYNDGLREFETEKAKAQKELDDALKKINDGEKEIKDNDALLKAKKNEAISGIAQLEDGISQIDNGLSAMNPDALKKQRAELETQLKAAKDGLVTIEQTKTELKAAETEIAKNEALVKEQEVQAQNAVEQLTAGIATIDTQLALPSSAPISDLLETQRAEFEAQLAAAQSGLVAIDSAKAQINAGKAELETNRMILHEKEAEALNGIPLIESGIRQIDDAFAQYNPDDLKAQKSELETLLKTAQTGLATITSSERDLEKAKTDLTKGRTDYETGKKEADEKLADAEKELADGKVKLEDAKAEIADIKAPSTFTLDRETNVGYVGFDSNSSIVEGIVKIFPVFFFLVAALVCTTTMTRMIEEHRTQIGTLKALGYSNMSIMWKYVSYSGGAAVLGCLVGFFGGTWMFPKTIWAAYSVLYDFAPLNYVFDWKLGVISLAVSILCSVGATIAACKSELLCEPAQLMRPKSPKAGKKILLERVPFIWNRFGFMQKVSVRNILRYKKRLFMMILGISGCAALVLAGFGVRDSVANIANDQFDLIMKYDYEMTFTDAKTKEDIENFADDTKELLSECVFVSSSFVDIECEDRARAVNIIATDDMNISKLIDLHMGSDEIPYPATGEAVISEKIAQIAGIKVGDTINVSSDEFTEASFKISAICENYFMNYIFVSAKTYEDVFNKAPVFKTAFADKIDGNLHEISAKLTSDHDVASIMVIEDVRIYNNKMMGSLNGVVILVIASAAALAFVVLFNLSNINITERIREIATIKVLGFYPAEINSYVFRENLVLTAIGAFLGMPLGVILHKFIMSQISIDMVNFRENITLFSFAASIAMTFLFNFAVNLVMRKKLNSINMAESLKSVE